MYYQVYWEMSKFLGNRVEDFLMDKIDRRRITRLSNLDYLGVDMVEAGMLALSFSYIQECKV